MSRDSEMGDRVPAFKILLVIRPSNDNNGKEIKYYTFVSCWHQHAFQALNLYFQPCFYSFLPSAHFLVLKFPHFPLPTSLLNR